MSARQIGLFADVVGERRNAVMSRCERFRFVLSRRWAEGPRCMFLMLNPSTADHRVNDRTVSRCVNFARDWGYGGLWVGNLFAFRSTDPDVLTTTLDAEGGGANDDALRWMAEDAGQIVCAWGVHGVVRDRAAKVVELLTANGHADKVVALRTTKEGHPGHPLYIPGDTTPQPYMRAK